MLDGDRSIETVFVSGCATTECLSDIEAHPDVGQFDTVDQQEDGTIVQLETLEPAVLSAASRAGTPLTYPATVNGGTLIATVVGTHAAISSLGEQLRAGGVGFEVAYIQPNHDGSRILTDRQEEVLFTAIERGYYESPRESTLTEVAEELGIAKSTCSATLQRAEGAIIEAFCSRQRHADTRTSDESGEPGRPYAGHHPPS